MKSQAYDTHAHCVSTLLIAVMKRNSMCSMCIPVLSVLEIKMVLTAQEKVFIIEHYFCTHGVGCSNGPSLLNVANEFHECF